MRELLIFLLFAGIIVGGVLTVFAFLTPSVSPQTYKKSKPSKESEDQDDFDETEEFDGDLWGNKY